MNKKKQIIITILAFEVGLVIITGIGGEKFTAYSKVNEDYSSHEKEVEDKDKEIEELKSKINEKEKSIKELKTFIESR